jgi:hypothetical protein
MRQTRIAIVAISVGLAVMIASIVPGRASSALSQGSQASAEGVSRRALDRTVGRTRVWVAARRVCRLRTSCVGERHVARDTVPALSRRA